MRLVARHGIIVPASEASMARIGDDLHGEVMPNFDHLSILQKIWSLHYLHFGYSSLSVRDRVLLGYFERLKPNLIHFHDAGLAASMRWIPTALGIPYTLSLRGSDIQVRILQSSARRDATLSAIEGAAKVHAVCHALGLKAARLLRHELDFSVIYTTLPIPPTLPTWHGMQADGQVHFLSSGRFIWRKGFSRSSCCYALFT